MDHEHRKARENPARLARSKRLAAALRVNVKRRKAQARARAQAEAHHPGAAHDSAGFVPDTGASSKD
jgi:hypothetical protein